MRNIYGFQLLVYIEAKDEGMAEAELVSMMLCNLNVTEHTIKCIYAPMPDVSMNFEGEDE